MSSRTLGAEPIPLELYNRLLDEIPLFKVYHIKNLQYNSKMTLFEPNSYFYITLHLHTIYGNYPEIKIDKVVNCLGEYTDRYLLNKSQQEEINRLLLRNIRIIDDPL